MRRLRGWARSWFDRAGFEVRRKQDPARLTRVPPSATAGAILEMTGPSGIGKSTLFHGLLDALEDSWFLPWHAAALQPAPTEVNAGLAVGHRSLLLAMARRLDDEAADFWTVAGSLRYAAAVASTDVLIRGDFRRGFALDEGVFQVFAPEIPALDGSARNRLCAGRLLVHLTARDPETVAERSMRRHEDRRRRGLAQRPTSLAAQRAIAEQALALHARVVETVRVHGVEVLELLAEDPEARNRQAILDFARNRGAARPPDRG